MWDVQLDPRVVRMPPFAEGEWLQTERNLTREALHGRILLIDFWDYTCINCLRTLPYLKAWHDRYAGHGLVIIGIHAPEFKFARNQVLLATAVRRVQLPYPILLDNEYRNWSNYANKAWPTKYLIDGDGYIRLVRQGEGYYREIEKGIQVLLKQQNPDLKLPDLLPALRAEDEPGAVCYRPTPELYAGYQGGGLFGGGLGNEEGYFPDSPLFYELPPPEARVEGRFYLAGAWQAWPEALSFAGQSGGRVVVPYQAAAVNGVLAPAPAEVDLVLGLRPSPAEPIVEVKQDGRALSPDQAGSDIQFDQNGASLIRLDQPRLYQLVQNQSHEAHELELIFRAHGLAIFAFSFSGCTAPRNAADDQNTYTVC